MSRSTQVQNNTAIIERQLDSIGVDEQKTTEALDVLHTRRSSLLSEARRTAVDAQSKPIHWLPPELLLEIFTALTHIENTRTMTVEFLMRPVVVSLVCHRWRALAHSAPGLWFRVPLYSHWATRTFLNHSKRVPLELVWPLGTTPWREAFSLLCPYIPRIRSIRWHAASSGSSTVLDRLLLMLRSPNSRHRVLQMVELIEPHPRIIRRFGSFAVLEELRLVATMVYPRPGVPLPRLRLLKLDHRESLLSELYRLVTCAPNLKTLVLANTVPMQDVILQSASDADGSLPRVLALLDNGDTHDVPMAGCLEHLDWSFAPPAYTWLLFVLLPMPNLRSLALCLNTESTLWPQYMSDDPLFLDIAQNGIPVRLSSLQELVVQCIDDGALKHVFRKIRCPVLAKLHITYLPPLHASCELPQLPRLESMFCDPRLYTLTDLKLSHFTLDPDEARIMLRYMPALTHLTFLECPQVAAVICALSGGSCDNGHENPFNVWICPRLEVLRVVDSPDLKFQCLRGMIHARSQAFGAPAPCMSSASSNTGHTLPGAPSPRVVKPLRRKFRDAAIRRACNVTLSPSAGRATAAVYNPYAAVRPSQLRTVCIEGCGRVSQIEATSLRGEFPSLRVKWQP